MPLITTNLALALEAWAVEITSGFPVGERLNSYEHMPRSIEEALPLVICDVKHDRVSLNGDASIPGVGEYQQTVLRIWTADLMLLATPDPTWTASQLLYKYVDTLGDSLRRDPTLGNRVPSASPLYDANYDPPEVEYADGTVARQVTFTIIIGEPLEV